jgi:hypothetical protein
MPGAYAHMTLVNFLREPQRLETIPAFTNEIISAILEYFRFIELGAVSPDYPYLAIGDNKAAQWADTMHYTNTGGMIQAGVDILKSMDGEVKRKGLAWLFGYTAHVAMDVSIHPIVELKVGKYAKNKRAHRECEMHQDAYIFQRLNLGEVGLSEHLDSGIARCGENGDSHNLDSAIVSFWGKLLKNIHPEQYTTNTPDIKKWHRSFMHVVDKIAEEGNHMLPLSRHVAVDMGLTYPSVRKINKNEYINSLQISHDPAFPQFLSYDEIFDKTVSNVLGIWEIVASGISSNDTRYLTQIGEWDLDTGRNQQDEKLVFWS